MSVGSNIKKRRMQLRMSQQELADAMGYKTRSTIAKIESGENDVTQKKLQKLAQILDTTPETLVSGLAVKQDATPFEDGMTVSRGRHKHVVVILAGGKAGKNLQSIPTQFIHVLGKPILVYSMDAYQNHPSIDEIFVVCAKGWENIVRDYAYQYGITKLKGIVPSGNSGTASLKNAVDYLRKYYSPDDFVVIQEATRPMVTTETIHKVLFACEEKGTATICHSMKDYVQFHLHDGKAKYVDRNTLIALQSPEAHKLSLLCRLYDQAEQQGHMLKESCCTMLMNHLGFDVHFIESNVNNVKLIREEDIAVFQAQIKTINE